jgi:DNA-binding NtrC family response regulator
MCVPALPRVLVVDDEPLLLRSIVRILRRLPVEVVTVENAEVALSLLDKQTFGLVISDQGLPGMSGTSLLAQVRQRWPETSRLLLTGGSFQNGYRDEAASGAFLLMPKPCHAAELRRVVREILDLPG